MNDRAVECHVIEGTGPAHPTWRKMDLGVNYTDLMSTKRFYTTPAGKESA